MRGNLQVLRERVHYLFRLDVVVDIEFAAMMVGNLTSGFSGEGGCGRSHCRRAGVCRTGGEIEVQLKFGAVDNKCGSRWLARLGNTMLPGIPGITRQPPNKIDTTLVCSATIRAAFVPCHPAPRQNPREPPFLYRISTATTCATPRTTFRRAPFPRCDGLRAPPKCRPPRAPSITIRRLNTNTAPTITIRRLNTNTPSTTSVSP